MANFHKKPKHRFEGSLARRVILVCLALLIVPLFINSGFLYWRELQLEEQDVQDTMKAVGTDKAEDIARQIQTDWTLLSVQNPAVAKAFQIERVPLPEGASERFAILDPQRDVLVVGVKADSSMAYVIAHPTKDLFYLPPTPYPIDIAFAPHLPHDEEWVENFPIQDTNLVLTIGTSRTHVRQLQQSLILYRVGVFIALIGLVGGTLVYFLTRKLAKPLWALCQTMMRVADGSVHSRFKPKALGFEINGIGNLFNETMDALLAQQQLAERERIEREKLAHELKLGHDIQQSLIPEAVQLPEGHEVATGYLPATEVGGDFCDVLRLDRDRLLLAIADIAGKGVSACLFSLGLRSSLRALATSTYDVAELVEKVNELFLLDVKESGMFATLWVGVVEGNQLRYLNLGHPRPLFKRGGNVRELNGAHAALGVMPLKDLKAEELELKRGDELLLYSDGVTEAHDLLGNLYGTERLKRTFAQPALSSSTSIQHVLESAAAFSRGVHQHDDISLLALRW